MGKLKLNNPTILEKLAKSFVGDDIIPYPYRSGGKLVNFFNEMGFNDIYGAGFPTRWRYAKDKIQFLQTNNRFEEFLLKSISIDELLKFEGELNKDIFETQEELLNKLNNNIFKYTDYEIKKKSENIIFIKKEPLKSIGSGFFADVFLIKKNDEKRALKKLKEEFWSNQEYKHRLKREYELMKNCYSEYCIKVFDYFEKEYAFEMELADFNLKEYIEKNNHIMNIAWKESIVEDIINGMKKIHETTIHRDLSYKNILILDNRAKLADFGLGKDLSKLYSYATVSEQQVGTPHFTDPIQKQNLKNANFQTDIYSLGQIIDFIFCGSIISEEHKYSSIVVNATHRDLDKRYKTVKELYEAYLALKNSQYNFDPVGELIKMNLTSSFSSEKIYTYFIRKDRGKILFDLILENHKLASEYVSFFFEQYNHEVYGLISEMSSVFESERLQFSDYDKFGYFSIDTIAEIEVANDTTSILSEITKECAFNANRFNIQIYIENNKNNKKIPYHFRYDWESSK